MHFWIDKRSQQCGFGRSRVAASLSGSGSTGMGLGFGHPPRRMGGGNKSSTTRSALPDCHHSNTSNTGTSRSHQHHHQQPHASNNNNFNSNGNHCQHAHTNANTGGNTGGSSSSGNAATAAINVATATTANAIQSNLNNNPHQYAYQQHSSHSNHPANNSNTNTINTINQYNNNASAAIVTDVGAIAPASHSFNQRAATATTAGAVTAQYPPPNHHYDLRSYHHPQFGNMSLRHYQHATRNCGPSHTNAAAVLPHNAYGSSVGGIGASASSGIAGGTGGGGPSTYAVSNVQHVEQPQYRQPPQAVHHSAYSHIATNDSACIMAAPPQAIASYAVASTTQRYNSGGTIRTSHMNESAHDVQLLPSHLKCGMCASLMLASVFVAGAKFYFDHQGTGLEVLIFCAFSTTFFLAACTVSLCRVPKGLLPGVRPAGVLDEHQHGRGGTVHCAVGGGGAARVGVVGTGLMGDSHATPLYGQQPQLIEESLAVAAAAATAGPPPYHIAIFFPEAESSSKAKEAPLDDESPPPSYDKILI